MKKIEINTEVENGLPKNNKKIIRDSFWHFEGKKITLVIKEQGNKRSNQQNAFYWGVIIPILQDGFYNTTGDYYTISDIHDAMKAQFCFKEIVNIETAEILKMPLSTTDLTTMEWEIFIDKIRNWSANFLGINLPFPNEQMEIQLI